MSSRSFTVEILIEAKNKAKGAFGNFKKGFSDALTIPKSLNDAANLLGGSLANIVNQLPQMAAELVKLGVDSQTVTNRFEKFAGGSERATELLDAFNEGALNTVDRMTAMAKSTKLLSLGLVDNADEMRQVAQMAIQLGDQTMDTGSRIDDFGALLANMSTPRLDNFGISSGKVRLRIKELLASGQALSRDQAFKMAVMEEGAKSLDKLGDTSELTSVKLDRSKAAIQDLKIDAGTALLGLAENINIFGLTLDNLPDRLRGLTTTIKQIAALSKANREAAAAFFTGRDAQDAWRISLQRSQPVIDDILARHKEFQGDEVNLRAALEETALAIKATTAAMRNAAPNTSILSNVLDKTQNAYLGLTQSTEDATDATEDQDLQFILMTGHTKSVVDALKRVSDVERDLGKETDELTFKMRNFALQQTMSFTQFERQVTESAERFADQREQIDANHQEKLAKLAKRGQAKAVQLNEAAEQEKLATLQWRLEQALLQQSEFTAKTKESTQRAKEKRISDLQADIAEQTQLIDDFNAGKLFKSGENVSLLVEQENLAHQERVADLEAAELRQEELQRQSLGRMILQSFVAWATMRGIPADKMLEMRLGIAEEFGLIDSETAETTKAMVGDWEKWATDTGIATDDVILGLQIAQGKVVDLGNAVLGLPSTKTITIDIVINRRETGRAAAEESGALPGVFGGGGLGSAIPEASDFDPLARGGQLGSSFARGGVMLVGEEGPELVNLPPGASVTPSTAITNNFNMTVNTRAQQSTVVQDFETMRAVIG